MNIGQLDLLFLDCSSNKKKFFSYLISQGVKLELIEGTQLIIGIFKGIEYYFMDNYFPNVPHNIGLILTDELFIKEILDFFKIKNKIGEVLKQKNQTIYIDKNNYLFSLEKNNSFKEKKLFEIGKKILEVFSPLKMVKISGIWVKNNFYITRVSADVYDYVNKELKISNGHKKQATEVFFKEIF